jgi:hypothetical protein
MDSTAKNGRVKAEAPVRRRVYQYSRRRVYQYSRLLTLSVGRDLDHRFHCWLSEYGRYDRLFFSEALPPRKTFAEAEADLERFARAKGLVQIADEQVCRVCGCTHESAFCEETGEPCHWIEEDLCSACVGKAEDSPRSHGEHGGGKGHG